MKSSTKRLLTLLTVLALVLSLLPGFALAAEEEVLVTEGSATFATNADAFSGVSEYFTPDTNGTVTVQILSCSPGYYVDLYEDTEWLNEYAGSEAGSVIFPVTAGREYEILLSSYELLAPGLGEAKAGSISYQITFLSSGESSGGGNETPEDPSLLPGGSAGNPLTVTGSHWEYIGAGKTRWYLYDNTQNMAQNGSDSMMLHITSSADYSVSYAGQTVPVDENGFVNYEMMDTEQTGLYLFSITNNGADEKFFSLEVKEKPIYFNTGNSLSTGRNNVTLDSNYPYTLYEFSPSQTGIYQIKVTQGRVGDWGTPHNPIDNTPNKTNTLVWTCTSVGQSLMVGFTGPQSTTCTIIRTGNYVPPVEIPWTFYENTYDFSYVLPAGEVVDVDLTDGSHHTAELGADGFYHYGSAEGPLMVADLSKVEINISDAYVNGGLRAWLTDENGNTISKVDYNEALNAYYNAGPVPVTGELATMLLQLGQANGWWVSGGLVFGETAPEDMSMAWMQLCGYLKEPEGVSLCGSITAGTEGDVTLSLLAEGEVIATVSASGTYRFETVVPGSYTLKVSKANHVTREYTVTADADLTLDVKLHLIGDIDGNGKINVGDVSKLNGHIKGSNILTDEYMILCANINGGSLNMGDVSTLYAHIKGTRKLY